MTGKIGFIGVGSMGFPMARNLIKAGYDVTIYNRTQDKIRPLVEEGAKIAKRPVDVLSDGCVVISIVSNDQALDEITNGIGGLAEGLKSGHIHISMSTISPDISRKFEGIHKEKGADYLVATVSGRPERAALGKLWIFLAGMRAAKEKVMPILHLLGEQIFDVGEDPVAGNVVKLCGNFLIGSALEAISEACAFAEKNGLDRSVIGKVFAESLFACPIFKIYSPLIAAHTYTPAGFKLELGLKDINMLLDAAKKCQQPLPLANLVQSHLLTSMARGRKEMDWSALGMVVSEEGGKLFD